MSEKSNSNQPKVVVIGGGFAGLSSAALLAKQGYQVTLLEKNKSFGGRARVLDEKGFHFDMGPSWYLMPEVFEHFFSLFGKKTSDYYRLERLDPRYQVLFEDGEKVTFGDDLQQNILWFEKQESGAGEQLEKFLQKLSKIYQLSADRLMYLDVNDWSNWLDLKNISSVLKLLAMQKFWQSWNKELSRYFKSEKLKKILAFPAVFLGGSPYNTPALYSLLSWADFGEGVWYPHGGMGEVIKALVGLSQELGVELVTDVPVISLEINNRRVEVVKTNKKTYQANIVVAATDMPHVELDLLSAQYRSYSKKYWQKKTLSISGLLLYLGLSKRYKKLVHHTLYFCDDWKKNFSDIFNKKVLPKNPSLYVSVRSATDRSIVPENGEELFVLVPLGAGASYSPNELENYSDLIIKKLEKLMGIEIENNLVVKKIFGPNDFMNDYNAYGGTALGLAHTLDQSLWFRPNNRSKKVSNLYYAGQYTNPGVGVPMALISAQIVANMINLKQS